MEITILHAVTVVQIGPLLIVESEFIVEAIAGRDWP